MKALAAKEMYRFSSEMKKKGISSSTINCIIMILRSAWKAEIIMDIVTKSIADVIVRLPIELRTFA